MPHIDSIMIDGAELVMVVVSVNEHGDKTVTLSGYTKDGKGIMGVRYPQGSAALGIEKRGAVAAPYAYRAPTEQEWLAVKRVATAGGIWHDWQAGFVSTAKDAGKGKPPFWEDDDQRAMVSGC